MKKILTIFDLKVIAILTMTIDHAGALFFDNNLFMRKIGRISFPLIAFALVEGLNHTRNKFKYLLRIILVAIISEPIYDLVMFKRFYMPYNQNILFSLSLGLLLIIILSNIDNSKISKLIKSIYHLIFVWIFLLLAIKFRVSYQIYGILLVYVMYLFSKNIHFSFLGVLTMTLILWKLHLTSSSQLYCLLSYLFLILYSGSKGDSMRWFFYLYYPLHFFYFFLLKLFLGI